MRRFFLFFVPFFVLFCVQTATAGETTKMEGTLKECRALVAKGLHKDALDKLRPVVLDEKPKDGISYGDAASLVVDCLVKLNRIDEVDEFLETAVRLHKNDWRLLRAAAGFYANSSHFGQIIDDKFVRGGGKGQGVQVWTAERDRARAVQLMTEAMPLVLRARETEAARMRNVAVTFFRRFADILMNNRQGEWSWKLQMSTDLETLPDYETMRDYGGFSNGSSSPVDEDGNPVYYYLPNSFEEAKNDGQRWRWCLARMTEYDTRENAGYDELRLRAEFCENQFGQRNLRDVIGYFRGGGDPADKAHLFDLATLSDKETITRLATGIRRFELPDEFNYIELWKKIAEIKSERPNALDKLAEIAVNRMQFEKAAAYLRERLEIKPDENVRARLDQIVGNWGRFEPTGSKAVGVDATLRYTFRNGTRVKLTAHAIKVPELIADVKAYLKSKPKQLDWNRTNIQQIGHRLIFGGQDDDDRLVVARSKYLGEKAAEWAVDLKPAPKHFDRQTEISVPIKKAGAYLVKAELEGGNTQYLVLWLDDTVIVKKQLDGAMLYFVADAVTGQPVAGATLDFFGYKMEWKSIPQPGGRQRRADAPEWSFDEFRKPTDENGLFVLKKRVDDFNWLVTTRGGGDDGERSAFLGFNRIWFSDRYDAQYNEVKAFVITDRPVYRPNDTVKIKTWVAPAKYDMPDTNMWAGHEVTCRIVDPRGEEMVLKEVNLDKFGAMEAELELPRDAKLGQYQISVGFGDKTSHNRINWIYFRVEEYKKPEYEVTVDAPKEPVRLGETIKAKISAKYYFGSPVTEATVKYKVLREKHDAEWFPWRPWDWFYGGGYGWLAYDTPWLPGWRSWGVCRPMPFWFGRSSGPPEVVAERELKIGSDGTVDVEIDTAVAEAMFPGQSQKYSITAEVVDNSRRTIVGTGTVLVSKEPFKVYAWVDRGYYESGQKIEASFQARRLDGKPVPGDAEVKVYKITYNDSSSQETEVHAANVKFDAEGKANLSLNAAGAGQYRIACKLDGQEGAYVFNVYSELRSANADWRFNALELLPEKAEYAPGENVALKVNSDRKDAFVLLFVKPTNGVALPPQVLRLDNKSQTVEIRVEMKDMPNLFIEALIVSDGEVVTEMREIAVPPQKRILNVEVKPSAETYKPGAPAKMDLTVTDLAGTPASGQIVVSIYDKSVEYISGGSNVEDIKEFFWKWRRHHHPGAESSFIGYSSIFDEARKPGMARLGLFGNNAMPERGLSRFTAARSDMGEDMVMAEAMDMDAVVPMAAAAPMMKQRSESDSIPQMNIMGAMMAGAGHETDHEMVEPTVRSNFADTALWVGAIETDKDGKAQIELDMPESLTTWKINVWSMAPGTRVGHGTAEVITRKDLIVRMQTPRFLVEKDRCVFSANVHNYLPNEKEVKIILETSPMRNEVELGGGSATGTNPEAPLRCASGSLEQVVKIPAGGEARVDWTVEAKTAGDAMIVMKALTDEDSDAMQRTLPVYVHGMLKQEAWSGYVAPDKESGSVEIRVPEERKPEQTKLTVRFSPTLAASMIDALPYLVDYPYGCTEQTLNRFLPTVIVQKILREMNVDLEKLKTSKTNLNAQELFPDGSDDRKPSIARKVEPVYDIEQVREMVKDGVTKLTNMQCSDGGWGWFGGHGERSSAHLTALVVHGLRLAQQNDVAVDRDIVDRGEQWLHEHQKKQVELLKNGELPEEQRKKIRYKTQADETDAFVMMVLSHAPKLGAMSPEMKTMRSYLWRDRAKLSLYGVAMTGIGLHAWQAEEDKEKIAACVKMLEQYLVQDEENQTAWLNLRGSSGWYWWCWHGSEFETQAYYLKLLMRTDPKSPVAPRLVKYLLNNRRHATYWNSTRDTAIVIEAFAEFLRSTGEMKPEMTVEVLLDGDVKKTAKITPENLFEIDNTLLLEADAVTTGTHKVELRKKGEGPLYFNAYLENFTLEDPIGKAGLEVKIERRIYRLVRDESAKTQASGGRGQVLDMKVEKYKRVPVESFKSGELVEIELVIESKNDYESIIIEDRKAAGLEPVDIRSGYNGNELGAYVEFRDERVAFFVYRLMKGKHSVSYRLRAEQPGSFSALPAKIEAMYAPELKGNSDENKVNVSDR